MRRVRLLDDIHETWCPKGTAGTLYHADGEFFYKFMPDDPPEGFPWPDGVYIGGKRYEEMEGGEG